MRNVLVALLAAHLGVFLGGIAEPAEPFDARIAALFQRWDEPNSPGVSVLVARNGEPVYRRSFGQASLTYGLPITADTRFNAGSIAKQVTAVGVLVLEEQGRLTLDDEIHRYLPELPDYGAAITLRHLLQQTSGLRDYRSLMALSGWRSGDVQTHEQALELIFRQHALNFRPGTSFIYSNSNFVLAAEIVARLTGEPFPDWAQAQLFAPIGMEHTLIRDHHATIVPGLASSYDYRGEERGYVEDLLDSSVLGSGNLVTTADDLLRWANYLRSAVLDGTPLLERLTEQAVLPGDIGTGYGLGVFVGTHRGLPIVHHAGETAGNRAYLMIFPEQRTIIVILANTGSLRPEAAARAVADIVLEDEFPAPAGATGPAPEPALPIESYAGLYELETGIIVEIGLADGVLYVIVGGTPAHPLLALGGHDFRTDQAGVALRFAPDERGAIDRLIFEAPDAKAAGRKVPPPRLDERELAAYAGTYFSSELETFYRLLAADGGLVVQQLRLDDVRLEPIGGDRFLERPGGGLLFEFRRDRRGRVEGFDLSISRARNIAFERRTPRARGEALLRQRGQG